LPSSGNLPLSATASLVQGLLLFPEAASGRKWETGGGETENKELQEYVTEYSPRCPHRIWNDSQGNSL
jgi:hypothetical protein